MFDKFFQLLKLTSGKPDIDLPGASLLRGTALAEADLGEFRWNANHNSDILTISNNGATIEWGPRKEQYQAEFNPCFVPASTCAHLHSASFEWDFIVDEMSGSQIGIGFMLLWDIGPDWGFFGYLGASKSAWSYDPSTGDVVCNTVSVQGGLPVFANGRTGTVTVHLELPRCTEGKGWFSIDGRNTKPIRLPRSSVVMPAACFLKETQRITLANFHQL